MTKSITFARISMTRYLLLFLITAIRVTSLFGQVSNPGMVNVYDTLEKGKVTVGAYMDVYYGYDFSEPVNADRPYFVSSARHNEFNVNLAFADFRYINDRVRAHFVPGFGTYMDANYAGETGTLKYLLEANVGIKPFRNRGIWIDAGVLPSPYTNESPLSKDHLMYTRSFAPEYVPYYMSGVKVTVPLGKKVTAYGYLLNGWQTMRNENGSMSTGTQFEYRPGKKWLLNWNTYFGNENIEQDSSYRNRVFTDLYAIYNPDGKFSMTACIYGGIQKRLEPGLRPRGEELWGREWWQANLCGRYRFSELASVSGRVEYFDDPYAIMIKPVGATNGFSSWSFGLCLNLQTSRSSLFRLEGRYFLSDRDVYLSPDGKPASSSQVLTASLCTWF